MATLFQSLDLHPADPLLGLMTAFRADDRLDKTDLGVGVYRTEAGTTPVMAAVHKAELRLADRGETKAYEGPRGNLRFCEAVEHFVLGTDYKDHGRIASFTTPGGCGALYVGMSLIARANPDAQVWLSDPTWPNHPHVVRTCRLIPARYRYYAPTKGAAVPEAMFEDLDAAKPGDVVVVQGPCHNPTGADLSPDAWAALGKVCADKGITPFIDIAYHGFAAPLDEDLKAVRLLMDAVPVSLVSYSCSKSFGLYRERTGALIIQAASRDEAARAASHGADIARASYSMPPAHGAALVAEVLGDPALRAQWEEELGGMRQRIMDLRRGLSTALGRITGTNRFDGIAHQRGMFSLLPVTPAQVETMRARKGLYLPASGRINIAGLSTDKIDSVAEIIAATVADAPQGNAAAL